MHIHVYYRATKNMSPTKMLKLLRVYIWSHYLQFVHDHSTKCPVCMSNDLTFILSPKCVPYNPTGVASGGEIVNDTNERIPLADYPDLDGICCLLQVTDCLCAVFVHSVLQITPKVNQGGLNRVSVAPTQYHTSHIPMSRSPNRCVRVGPWLGLAPSNVHLLL